MVTLFPPQADINMHKLYTNLKRHITLTQKLPRKENVTEVVQRKMSRVLNISHASTN